MRLSELTLKAKDFLDYELQDGYGDEGGIPHDHYTLEEYLGEISEDETDYEDLLDLDMYELNKILVTESCIAPIPYNFEKERKDFACMIAYYYAQEQHTSDSFATMSEFVKYADSYDFKIDEWEFNNTGKYVLDAEDARFAAQSFAKEIANHAA